MAKFSVNGIDSLAADLQRLGQLDNEELVSDMLGAGAEVVAEEWIHGILEATKPDGRSTGDMASSVAPTKGIKKIGDISAKEIYPQGKDRKGVRNAEKAFILHYGKSGPRHALLTLLRRQLRTKQYRLWKMFLTTI